MIPETLQEARLCFISIRLALNKIGGDWDDLNVGHHKWVCFSYACVWVAMKSEDSDVLSNGSVN